MHNGRLITVFSARNYMDAVFNDSALLLLTLDDTNSLRVRIKTLSKKDTLPASVADTNSPRHVVAAVTTPGGSSDHLVREQFGKVRPNSNLLDSILVPEVEPRAAVAPPAVVPASGGGNEEGEGEGAEAGVDSIDIDYSNNLTLCSSQTNLNDILRETNHKSDKKFFKRLKAAKKKLRYGSSTEGEGEGGGGGEMEGEGGRGSSGSEGEEEEEKKVAKESFVRRLRHSVKEMFTRSASKEIRA
jgi:hypothetical protein